MPQGTEEVTRLEAELSQPLAKMVAELAQPPIPPWSGAMVLPVLCRRGHPWDVYHQGRDCRRCKQLLQRGDVLPTTCG